MKVTDIDPNHLEIRLNSEAETEQFGRVLADIVEPGVVIGLVGTLGAGKTRLVRALAESLGVDPGAIASPTFVLIHEYPGRIPIYHFDAYRLTDPDAFEALGATDYWADGQGVCLIEWADLVADRLPRSTWWIRIEPAGSEARIIRVESPESARISKLLTGSGASAD